MTALQKYLEWESSGECFLLRIRSDRSAFDAKVNKFLQLEKDQIAEAYKSGAYTIDDGRFYIDDNVGYEYFNDTFPKLPE